MPVLWSFRCYVAPDGTNKIREWYDGSRKEVKAKFLSRLKMLSHLPVEEWNDPLYKVLHGECAGLGEIRFKADRVQQRPLGFRSGNREYTILFCAIEKGDAFVPRSACKTALIRKKEAKRDRSRTDAIWLALE